MSKGVQIAGGATAIALLLAWYAVANLDAKASYAFYQDLSEFRAADAAGIDRLVVADHVVLGEHLTMRRMILFEASERFDR